MRRGAPALLLGLLLGCAGEPAPAGPGGGAGGTGSGTGGDTDVDADGDTDVDPDADTDPDGGTDTDAPEDADGDGMTTAEGDCDDADPSVFAGAHEIWSDGVDQDCDGVDTTHADACAAAAPCPEASGSYANAEGWAEIEQCTSIPGMVSWTPQSGDGPVPNTCLEEVALDVVIDGAPGVRTLTPLSRLRYVGGDVKIFGLDALTDLRGLEALRETGEHILLSRNPALVDLSALAGVERIHRKLSLEDNAALSDLDPLLQIGGVGEAVSILGNPSLCAAPIEALLAHLLAGDPDIEVVVGDNGDC